MQISQIQSVSFDPAGSGSAPELLIAALSDIASRGELPSVSKIIALCEIMNFSDGQLRQLKDRAHSGVENSRRRQQSEVSLGYERLEAYFIQKLGARGAEKF